MPQNLRSHVGRSNFEPEGPDIAMHPTGVVSSLARLSLQKDSKCEGCGHVGHDVGGSTRPMRGTQGSCHSAASQA